MYDKSAPTLNELIEAKYGAPVYLKSKIIKYLRASLAGLVIWITLLSLRLFRLDRFVLYAALCLRLVVNL